MDTIDKNNLKVLRLDNGDILFSEVKVNPKTKDNGYLELNWPMKVLVKMDRDTDATHLALLKWLPFTDETAVPIAARCIISISNLGEEFKPFFLSTVEEAATDNKQSELNRMSRILMEFDENNALLN
jgi:hypothetical protein